MVILYVKQYYFCYVPFPQPQNIIFYQNQSISSGFPPNIIDGTLVNSNYYSLRTQEQRHIQERQPVEESSVVLIKTEEPEIIRQHGKSKQEEEEKLPFVDKHNIVPNNINHILAFIQRKSKSFKTIVKIMNQLKSEEHNCTVEGFYAYQKIVKNKLSVHVNVKALETATFHIDEHSSIFPISAQMFYNTVARMAIRYYLREIGPLVTLNSQRLRNTSKGDHLRAQRYILKILLKLDGEMFRNQSYRSEVK